MKFINQLYHVEKMPSKLPERMWLDIWKNWLGLCESIISNFSSDMYSHPSNLYPHSHIDLHGVYYIKFKGIVLMLYTLQIYICTHALTLTESDTSYSKVLQHTRYIIVCLLFHSWEGRRLALNSRYKTDQADFTDFNVLLTTLLHRKKSALIQKPSAKLYKEFHQKLFRDKGFIIASWIAYLQWKQVQFLVDLD